jgi:hypothetical protein
MDGMRVRVVNLTVLVVACWRGLIPGSDARADVIRPWEGAESAFDLFGNVERDRGATASLSSGQRVGPIQLPVEPLPGPLAAR